MPEPKIGDVVTIAELLGGKFYTMGSEKYCDMPTSTFKCIDATADRWQRIE